MLRIHFLTNEYLKEAKQAVKLIGAYHQPQQAVV
jgi:hypothetical protein